jgi:mycofactocin precursor
MPELAQEPTAVIVGRASEASPSRCADLPAVVDTAPALAPLVEDDMLVEEISIDGMCGVY